MKRLAVEDAAAVCSTDQNQQRQNNELHSCCERDE